MPTAFDVMFNASISRSENYSSDSLTKLPTICLYGLGFFSHSANSIEFLKILNSDEHFQSCKISIALSV